MCTPRDLSKSALLLNRNHCGYSIVFDVVKHQTQVAGERAGGGVGTDAAEGAVQCADGGGVRLPQPGLAAPAAEMGRAPLARSTAAGRRLAARAAAARARKRRRAAPAVAKSLRSVET